MKNYQNLKKVFKQLNHLGYTQRIMMWDEAVMMPTGAAKYRAATVASINKMAHQL